jgi:hypothetical protein
MTAAAFAIKVISGGLADVRVAALSWFMGSIFAASSQGRGWP